MESRASLAIRTSASSALEVSGSLRTAGTMTPHTAAHSKHQELSDAYLSELLSYSLDRLKKEPELLKDERQQLDRALQTTAVTQYGAFIETADCLETINSELTSVCDHLDLLLQGIPQLASSCESFSSKLSNVLEAYSQNKQVANHQSALLELLEIPQLIDTCVRNGVYDEALELQAFVSRMALLHPQLPLVKILTQQVSEVSHSMLQQLLSRLKTGLQLPECLRLMGYLRRIGAFTEADLRLHFLQCRDEWISNLIDDLDEGGDAYEYIKHLTDIHRLHLFDAVMQYRAIFFDGSSAAATTTGTTAPSTLTTTGTGAALQQAQDPAALAASVRESSMLYSWVQHRLSLYLDALQTQLPAVTQGGNLATVFEHCMYCGSSLARVGLDFEGLLLPLFETCTLGLLSQHLASAVDTFSSRLEAHKWVALHSSLLAHQKSKTDKPLGTRTSGSVPDPSNPQGTDPTSAKVSADGTGPGGEGSAGGVGSEDPSPPYVLMEHLPLASFTNGVLTAYNELRQCALQSCGKQAAGLVQQALEHVSSGLLHYRATHALPDSEAAQFRAATRVALDVMLPYLANCFAKVYQGSGYRLDTSGAATILRTVLTEA